MYNLVKTIVQLTDDQNNTEKVLQYIDKQSSPKSIPRVVQDLRQILKTDITDSDGRWYCHVSWHVQMTTVKK